MKSHDEVARELTKNRPGKLAQVRLETLKAKIIEDLVAIRERLELTQSDIASRIGMKQQIISRIENGENVTIDTLLRYMDGLHNVVKVEHAKFDRKNNLLNFITEIETEIQR